MIRYVLPLAVFLALVSLLAIGLTRDPTLVPSPLIGQPAPAFSLTDLQQPDRIVTRADLLGKVFLLNVWATWCVSCREEHEVLMQIARHGEVPIYGLNYKDDRQQAVQWLERLGNPYVSNLYDPEGEVGLDLGVYGTPESFLVDQKGVIVHKHVGPITPAIWQQELRPVIEAVKAR
ncbi:MAG: DsbE family thiol:disulfide interchange protein [Gammaproteobacteria bacterium]